MTTVHLIHWKQEELPERVQKLESAGYEVATGMESEAAFVRRLGGCPPAAIVIDLSRLPAQGRDFGIMLRKRKTTRYIPLVFVGGQPEKVERVRALLPDAMYCSWETIAGGIKQAISHPPSDPVVHDSAFAGYAGKPLAEKLGIKPGMVICLVHAPEDFEHTIGSLPEGVQLVRDRQDGVNLTIWFNRSLAELEQEMVSIVNQSVYGPVWLAWPKKNSGVKSDLTQQKIRDMGLSSGLVDYKICSIDDIWSGLLFRLRDK